MLLPMFMHLYSSFFILHPSSSFILLLSQFTSLIWHLLLFYFFSKFTFISFQGKDVAGVRPLVFPVTVTSKVRHQSPQQLSCFLPRSLIIIMFLSFSLAVFFTLISSFPPSIIFPRFTFLFRITLHCSTLQVMRCGAPDALDRLNAAKHVQVRDSITSHHITRHDIKHQSGIH
jgi:hypothetical protein